MKTLARKTLLMLLVVFSMGGYTAVFAAEALYLPPGQADHRQEESELAERHMASGRLRETIRALYAAFPQDGYGNAQYPSYFGGLYIDSEGNLVILVVGDDLTRFGHVADGAYIREAEFSYADLRHIMDYLRVSLPHDPYGSNIANGWYIDVIGNRVVVELAEYTAANIAFFRENVLDSPMLVFVPCQGLGEVLWTHIVSMFAILDVDDGSATLSGSIIARPGTENITVNARLYQMNTDGTAVFLHTWEDIQAIGNIWTWEEQYFVAGDHDHRLTLTATVQRHGTSEEVTVSRTTDLQLSETAPIAPAPLRPALPEPAQNWLPPSNDFEHPDHRQQGDFWGWRNRHPGWTDQQGTHQSHGGGWFPSPMPEGGP